MKKKYKEFDENIGRWEDSFFLWSYSGKFVGICRNNLNILMTAVTYNKEVAYVTKGFEKAKVDIHVANIKKSPEYLYSLYRNYIFYLGKNTKKVFIKDTIKNTAKKHWITVVILSRTHRIVFDTKEQTYFEQFLIPKDFRIELYKPQILEVLQYGMGKYKEPCVCVELSFDFPRDFVVGKDKNGKYSSQAELSKKCGWIMTTCPKTNVEYFKLSCMKEVISRLEKKNFVFKKNQLYHQIIEK